MKKFTHGKIRATNETGNNIKTKLTAQVVSVMTGVEASTFVDVVLEQNEEKVSNIEKTLKEKDEELKECEEKAKDAKITLAVLCAEDIPFFILNALLIGKTVNTTSYVEPSVFYSTAFNLIMLGAKIPRMLTFRNMLAKISKLKSEKRPPHRIFDLN